MRASFTVDEKSSASASRSPARRHTPLMTRSTSSRFARNNSSPEFGMESGYRKFSGIAEKRFCLSHPLSESQRRQRAKQTTFREREGHHDFHLDPFRIDNRNHRRSAVHRVRSRRAGGQIRQAA